MKAMIFAAGLGTRLKPLTDNMPKALVPLAGKSLLQWQVEKMTQAGIHDIIVNIHHKGDMIINAVQQHNGWGAHISISDERERLLDTGGGVLKIKDERLKIRVESLECREERLLVCNVDILSNIDLGKLMQAAGQENTLVVSERPTQRYLCFDEDGYLCGWTNIATGQLRGKDGRHLAYSGMAVLNDKMDKYLRMVADEKGDVFGLIDVYLKAAECGEKIKAYIPANYRMMDVGKYDQLEQAEQFAQQLLI